MSVQSIKANILNVQMNSKLASRKVAPSFTSNTQAVVTNPLINYLDAQAAMNKTMVKSADVKASAKAEEVKTEAVAKVEDKAVKVPEYKNNFRTMLQNGESKILAIVPRIFNAKDENGDVIYSPPHS